MKVRIDAGGREVEVECADANVSPADLLGEALKTWQATDTATEPSKGPAYGYSQERRNGQFSPMGYGVGPGRGDYADPRAEEATS